MHPNKQDSPHAVGANPDPTHPDFYKKSVTLQTNVDIEDIFRRWDDLVPDAELPKLQAIIKFCLEEGVHDEKSLQSALLASRKVHCCSPKKSELLAVFLSMASAKEDFDPGAPAALRLRRALQKKSSKSQSGVLVITVLTSPFPKVGEKTQRFSCKWNCYYCPNEPGQPRSYLHDEPAVLRANQNAFDPVLQFTERAATLAAMGHPVDKIELLVLGGTWASYPHAYQEEFCRDLFYAANTFWQRGTARRKPMALEHEQLENESAACKVIGLTLETRPDTIDVEELRRLRRYGCTRVQLGLQHTDDAILKKINRESTRADAVRAIALLKNACYKLDVHLMPNLPGASPEVDQAMFDEMLEAGEGGGELQADQWKIYPCEIVPWTVIKKWADAGEFVPYADEKLFELLMATKQRVHPWIRLNRVVRDIPSQYILGGVDAPNMRQELQNEMQRRGGWCACIRCREVGLSVQGEEATRRVLEAARLTVRTYAASHATEHFISVESRRLPPASKRGKKQRKGAGGEFGTNGGGGTNKANLLAQRVEQLEAAEAASGVKNPEIGRLRALLVIQRERHAGRKEAAAVKFAARGGGAVAAAAARSEEETEAVWAKAPDLICGFLRLRICEPGTDAFPELEGCALVRELHVYGELIPTGAQDELQVEARAARARGEDGSDGGQQREQGRSAGKKKKSQHGGFGKLMMARAEEIAWAAGRRKLAVIAGIGTRNYYRKLGYTLHPGAGGFMIKTISRFHGRGRALVMTSLRTVVESLPRAGAAACFVVGIAHAAVGNRNPEGYGLYQITLVETLADVLPAGTFDFLLRLAPVLQTVALEEPWLMVPLLAYAIAVATGLWAALRQWGGARK